MQWVIHGTIAPAAGEAIKRHGHSVHTIEELALPAEPTFREIIWTANKKQWDLLTNDAAFIQWIYEDRFPFKRSIVFMQLAGGDVEQDDAVDRLFARYKRLTPGRLYTLTASRVKIRQLPTGGKAKPEPSHDEEDVEE